MKAKLLKFAFPLLALSMVSSAEPFKLPRPNLAPTHIDAGRVDVLVEAVTNCYPEPSAIDRTGGKLDFVARYGKGQKNQNTIIADTQTNYIGLQFSLPLWSPQDVERDRTRELTRRKEIAVAVGRYLTAISTIAGNRSRVDMFQQVEHWESLRVNEGIDPTNQQVEAIKAVIDARQSEIVAIGDFHSARAELLAYCPKAKQSQLSAILEGFTK